MPDGKRLWRTASGRLVADGHPEAVFLAYGPNDELPPDEKPAEPVKAVRKPADKQVRKPADK